MTTIVNSPAQTKESGGLGFLVGVIVIIGFFIVLLYFGLPMIRNMGPLQLNIPAPQVVMPDKIDVNVNQSK